MTDTRALELARGSRQRWRPSFVILLVVGCSKAAPDVRSPGFLRASPIVEYGTPSVEPKGRDHSAIDTRLDVDGVGKEENAFAGSEHVAAVDEGFGAGNSPRPNAAASPQTQPTNPAAVIAQANAMATQAPESEGFINAVMQYTYLPGAIFEVVAAPNNVTDIVLEPGEELMGEPAAGDTLRWRLGVGTSAVNGTPQKHVFIKPTRAGLATNLTLNTNRRTYFLKLESVDGEFMVAVQWSYPQALALPAGPLPSSSPSTEPATTSPADVTALNFDYAIEVAQGRPAWKPQAVYDDGQKTYIRFDSSILHGESPALFVMERGELQLVNYRVKQNLYVVDRLFAIAELRLGQDDQDIVRLRNRKRSDARAPAKRSSSASKLRRPGTPR